MPYIGDGSEADQDASDHEENNPQKLVEEMHEAVIKDEKISRKLVHGILIGPTGTGKSSLIDRLLGRRRKGFSSSTGVSESVVMIDISLANPSELHSATVEGDAWGEVEFDTSVARQMEEGIELLAETRQPEAPIPPPDAGDNNPSVHLESSSTPNVSQIHLKSAITTQSTTAIIASAPSVREVIEQIVKKSGGAKRFKHFLTKSFSLYLRDTGGQVEFQEMLPLLISGPSIFFFVFRLDLDFEKKFRVEYRKSEGESLNCYISSITTEEAFLQSMASVNSIDISDEVHGVDTHKTFVFIVGTHKDNLGSSAAQKIAELNEHLKSLIKAHHFEHLVQSADRDHVMFTVDNTSEDDADFQLIRSKFNNLVRGRKEFTIEYPLRYLLFCLELQSMRATILTLDKCKVMAAKFGIQEEQLLHLLLFLHLRIGVIRYFDKDGVRHIVIKEPQVLFNAVTNLIVMTFSSEAVTDEEATSFQKKGIVTASCLDNISALGDISPEVFLELLVHLRIAAPFVPSAGDRDSNRKNYFLPSVLNHVPESNVDLNEPATSILPLAVQFKCQHCPKGLFGVLVVHLMMLNDGATTTFALMPERIFKDEVSFIVCSCDSVHDQVTLKVYMSHLEMKFFPGLSEDREVCITEVCSNVRQIVETAIHQSLRDLHYSTSRAKPEMCVKVACDQCDGLHPVKKLKIYCAKNNATKSMPDGGKWWYDKGQ